MGMRGLEFRCGVTQSVTKSNDNLKWNITRVPEFGSEISLRTENN